MKRTKREHLLLQVLEDDLVHPRPKLRPGLPVLRVVRECGAGRLERPRVEDELAGGPRTARLGRRGRVGVRLGVGRVRGARVLAGRDFRVLARDQLARGGEPGDAVEFLPPGLRPAAAVRPEVRRVLAEVGGIGARRAEIDYIPDVEVAGDRLAAAAGAFAREAVAGDGAEAGGPRWRFGRRGGAFGGRVWMLGCCIARSSRAKERAMRSEAHERPSEGKHSGFWSP